MGEDHDDRYVGGLPTQGRKDICSTQNAAPMKERRFSVKH